LQIKATTIGFINATNGCISTTGGGFEHFLEKTLALPKLAQVWGEPACDL
jgi:hypothetical protein